MLTRQDPSCIVRWPGTHPRCNELHRFRCDNVYIVSCTGREAQKDNNLAGDYLHVACATRSALPDLRRRRYKDTVAFKLMIPATSGSANQRVKVKPRIREVKRGKLILHDVTKLAEMDCRGYNHPLTKDCDATVGWKDTVPSDRPCACKQRCGGFRSYRCLSRFAILAFT